MIFASEMISMIAGGLSGFIFKLVANAQADRAALLDKLIRIRQEADVSADKAAKRDDSKAGQYTRRLIVIAVLFGIIVAPFIFPLLTLPTIVQIETPVRSWLGLWTTGGTTSFYEINGYLVSPTLTSCAIAIISFYFGTAAGKRE